jgi:hypothetical protein
LEAKLDEVVKASLPILALPENFDGEGSPPYVKATWDRAVAFLYDLGRRAAGTPSSGFPLPRITPGPGGSIDLFWETPAFELLLNVPADPAAPATFDGDNHGQLKLSGSMNGTEPAEMILRWIQIP